MIEENEEELDDSAIKCDQCDKHMGSLGNLYDNFNRLIAGYELQIAGEPVKHFCTGGCLKKFAAEL